MKLLIVGEGTDELGRLEQHQDGVISALVRNCFAADSLVVDTIPFRLLSATRAKGELRRASTITAEARRRGCDGVVVLRDGDRQGAKRRAELEAGLAPNDIPHAVGVAIETLEAWLLADPDALSRAIGAAAPGRPEMLWGTRTDPSSNHPKLVWKRLCAQNKRDGGSATKVEGASRASITTLRARCPEGFAPFHDALLRAFPPFDIVVAADDAWGIGKDNALPWPRLKEDLAHFKRVTSTAAEGRRNAIIMGRRTWESKEVNKRPLPKRHTVVISRGAVEGVTSARALTEAAWRAKQPDDIESVFVVGGAEIYREALAHPRLRHVYLTRVHGDFACDTRIPAIDWPLDPTWPATQHEDNGVRYTIERLTRRPGT